MSSSPPCTKSDPAISPQVAEREIRLDIVVIMRSMVPYWIEFLDSIAVAWGNRGKITIISGEVGVDSLHPWDTESQGTIKVAEGCNIPTSNGRFGTAWPGSEMWKTLNRLSPSIVIIHEYSPYVVLSGLIWAKANRRACILTSDVGPVQRQQLTFLQRIVHYFVNISVDGMLARTQDAFVQSRISKKTGILAPHAINTQSYTRNIERKNAPKRIIQVGSLIPRKGVDLLFKAFAEARRSRNDLELVLVGSGDFEGTRRMAEELAIADFVTLLDFLQPKILLAEYSRSDVFVLASRFDSYGVVVHEAASVGLPLVVSKFAGASSTLIVQGKNGFQIDPNDTSAFSDAILRCLDSDLNWEFSKNSREIAEKFDVQSIASDTALWLEQFLKTPQFSTEHKHNPSFVVGCWNLVVAIFCAQFKDAPKS